MSGHMPLRQVDTCGGMVCLMPELAPSPGQSFSVPLFRLPYAAPSVSRPFADEVGK